jgi:hypothetical protein
MSSGRLGFYRRRLDGLSWATKKVILFLRVAPVEIIPSIASHSCVSNHVVANSRSHSFSSRSLDRQSLLNGAKVEGIPRSVPVVCSSLGIFD